ncbi:MAG: zinc dependent phospholipase C family protein [Erysipelotrichales bacterium]
MPAIAMHHFYALEVAKRLSSDLQKIIEENQAFYNIGAQGPDIFFFYKPILPNKVNKYGVKLHHQNASRLLNNKHINKEDINDQFIAYLLGYVTHFSLDSSFHPIINQVCPNFNEHMILESELERIIIAKNTKNKDAHLYKRHQLIDINQDYGKVLSPFYSELHAHTIDRAIKDMHKYTQFLYAPENKRKNKYNKFFNIFVKKANFSNMMISENINDTYDSTITYLLSIYEQTIIYGQILCMNLIEHLNDNIELDKSFNKDFE